MSNASGSQLVEYDSGCYQVECIREQKVMKGKKLYLIKWKGWDDKDNTWEPIENLQTVLGMVDDFQKKRNKGDEKSRIGLSLELPKKTKIIEKEKKKKKADDQSDISKSQSEVSSSSRRSIREKKPKNSEKKIEKKETKKNMVPNISAQKQKEKQLEIQKTLSKEKKDQEKPTSMRKSQSFSNNKLTKDSLSSSFIPKQSSKSIQEQQFGDVIEITRINYHCIAGLDHPHQPAKLYYNVDRRNKLTKKSLAVVDIPAEEILYKNPQMIVEYLEDCIKEVERYSYQLKETQNQKNVQNGKSASDLKRTLAKAGK